ncbi:MAG: 2-C-methyl-D-erythritol 4-phosphate cytidylyltransferase [Candidatus Theseobacter exili]|nr:2-C-methyl-D-erythritol 4-phosphate cytidylyltransferase [Candidatus Theseobacter exili]
MSAVVVIPAAGEGLRLGFSMPKAFVPLAGSPLLVHVIRLFERIKHIQGIVIVSPPGYEDFCRNEIAEKNGFSKIVDIVPGGNKRSESVNNGLNVVSDKTDLVLIHDAARPFVTVTLIEKLMSSAVKWGAAIPAVPVIPTIKSENNRGFVIETVDRRNLREIQTPQVFKTELIKKAYAAGDIESEAGTDDAYFLEKAGIPVRIVEGERENFKITTKIDLRIAEMMIRKKKQS